jgi:hypothetical protein
MELMEVGTKNSKLNLEVAKAKLLDWKNEIKNPQAIRSPGDFKQGEGGIT